MFNYRLGYFSVDGGETIELCHAEEFSDKEFEKKIRECTAKVLKTHANRHGNLVFDDLKLSTLYQEVADMLCNSFDFQRIQYTSSHFVNNFKSLFLNSGD